MQATQGMSLVNAPEEDATGRGRRPLGRSGAAGHGPMPRRERSRTLGGCSGFLKGFPSHEAT